MKTYAINKRLLFAAIMLIVLANAVVLARVAFNRFSVQETVTLTEREFSSTHHYRYNPRSSGDLVLRLQWKTPSLLEADTAYYNDFRSIVVTDANRKSMGFGEHTCNDASRAYKQEKQMVWLLMEYDGQAYQNDIALLDSHLQQAIADNKDSTLIKALQQQLDNLLHKDSRLYGIALAKHAHTLKKRINNPQREWVTKALVSNEYTCTNKLFIEQLFIENLHVPQNLLPSRQTLPLKYTLDIAFGNFGEPWITRISPGSTQ